MKDVWGHTQVIVDLAHAPLVTIASAHEVLLILKSFKTTGYRIPLIRYKYRLCKTCLIGKVVMVEKKNHLGNRVRSVTKRQ